MRLGQVLLGAGLLGLLAGCTHATAASTETWVEVSPNTVTAGSLVAVRADCGDSSSPTPATSEAFGSVTMQPQNSLLQAEVRVPVTTAPGRYEVRAECSPAEAPTTTLTVVAENPDRPTVGPHTGGGFLGEPKGGAGSL